MISKMFKKYKVSTISQKKKLQKLKTSKNLEISLKSYTKNL